MTDNDPNPTPGTRHPRTGFDLAEADRLLKTTKQVRRRLDLSRPVPNEDILECIDVANHAPMGGNLERNRWMIIDDPATKQEIAKRYVDGRPPRISTATLRARRRTSAPNASSSRASS